MNRAESIKYKLMREGHIRAFRTNSPDLPGVSEMMIYPPPYYKSHNNVGTLPETTNSE